jgi:molybdopterin synthase catalytic subunit
VNGFDVLVQDQPFDVGAVTDAMREGNPGIGAIATFVGVCRDVNDGDAVTTMWLEHYPGMTERAISAIIDTARQRWALLGCRVIHRIGELRPTDPIVLVAVASAHRQDAFAACEFVMDYLKTRAPFWKREATPEGGRWVAARASDTQAALRWRDDVAE